MAYIFDLLVFLVPAAIGAALVSMRGFEPSVGPGFVGLSIIALAGGMYALILVTMLASSGQTAGKRIFGLRVVSAGTGKPVGLGVTTLRTAAFFVGVLVLIIGPILAWFQQRKNISDELSWQHKLAGSTVLDIRAGVDPLNIEPAYYPAYPEEWVKAGEQSAITRYPPAPQPWSAAYQAPQKLAKPVRPDRSSLPDEQNTGKARPQWLAPGFQAAASLVAIGLVAAGAIWTSSALQPTIRLNSPTDFSATALAQQKIPLAASVENGFPGYTTGPAWKKQLGPNANAVSVAAGTFIFDDRKLTILDNRTGETINEQPVDGKIDFAQETQLGDEEGLIWRIGNQFHAWTPSMGKAAAVTMDIAADAKISAAGTSILVQNSDGKLFTPTKTGLNEMLLPEGLVGSAVDNGKLISTKATGTVTLTSPDGKDRQDTPLNPPKENLQFVNWVTAGRGLAVGLWSPYPNSTDPNSSVTISVYRLTTGELLSSLEVTKSRVDHNPAWSRGKGFAWASYAGYVYNLSTGLPILDILSQGIKGSDIVGDGVIGERPEGTVFLQPNKATLYSGVIPLAVAQDGIVIMTKQKELRRFTP